ncbi:MAG TPA: hypothetical protein VMA36_05890 [Candidatus Limnocylindria bacterium]|jgi:hypothetical protein|nr:hypothetical protein [Candidatus Limnocylindria bacterium]
MTDEAIFYHRFVSDVRSCASGRAPACVAEIERRLLLAMLAAPDARDRRWAGVIAAINALLADVEQESGHAERLRAFVRENADLWRGRDVAISDFRIVARAQSILTTANGRRYLAFTTNDQVTEEPPAMRGLGRVAAWGVYALCGAAALTALWFAFALPL